ncbi:tryptophan-rich sensory protein [Bacillota bacterium Meth-B3]|nr:tryptophan-rich sensory protein [Christensenellaceae bacterium]MEA5070192.1 tryptophan-rich sensory protein [Christensenellaceae bacterium]
MEAKTKSTVLKIMVAVSFVAMVIVNYLAQMLPINGVTPGQVSDSMPNLFAPAGLTFSIWGLIYLSLAAFSVYQFGFKKEYMQPALLDKVRTVFVISSLANIAWIFSWHYGNIVLSVFLMLALLLSLIFIHMTLDKARLSKTDKVFYRLPFSLYFGWITVATVANITALLVRAGWDRFGWSEQAWAIIILLVAMAIGTATMVIRKDIAYGLVLVWAYTGILIKHISPSTFAGAYPAVIGTVIACLVVYGAAEVYTVYSMRKTKASPAI